jgi:hypothetical protein
MLLSILLYCFWCSRLWLVGRKILALQAPALPPVPLPIRQLHPVHQAQAPRVRQAPPLRALHPQGRAIRI